MEWIIIEPEGQLDSLQRAKIISRELYNITRPVTVQYSYESEYYLFGWVTHPETGKVALDISTDYVIQVHPHCVLERLIAVFPELTPEERFNLSSLIHQVEQVTFQYIIPSDVTVRDYEYMIENGWMQEDDE